MRERGMILDEACAALIAGEADRCAATLDRFRLSVARSPLSEIEREACAAQLERLRQIAAAACDGVRSAQAWLAELIETTGRLDVYDRDGRQQLPTSLETRARRY